MRVDQNILIKLKLFINVIILVMFSGKKNKLIVGNFIHITEIIFI